MTELTKEEYVRMEVVFKLLNDDTIKNNMKYLIKHAAAISNFVLHGEDPRLDIINQTLKSTNPTIVSALDQLVTVMKLAMDEDTIA